MSQPIQPPPQKPKILFVDYTGNLNFLYEGAFRNNGFDVITALNGTDALNAMDRYFPDVVVAATELPALNGFDLTSQIKHNEKTKKVPVLLYSVTGKEEEKKRAREVGADDVIVRGYVSPAAAVDRVRSLLRSAEQTFLIKINTSDATGAAVLAYLMLDKSYVNSDNTINLFLKQDPLRPKGIFMATFVKDDETDVL